LEPDPTRRGHPQSHAEGVPYGVQRFVSRFDVFSAEAKFSARVRNRP
jgi:hypothetical protein